MDKLNHEMPQPSLIVSVSTNYNTKSYICLYINYTA